MDQLSDKLAPASASGLPSTPPDAAIRVLQRPWRWTARSAAVVAPLLLIGALAWPMLFTNATFNEDWLNHLWYMWHQSLTIQANHQPSLFLNYSHAVFYPHYAFYGGTLYALAGTLSLALGNAPLETYILTYLVGFAAAYGGWYWMSRMFGLGRWQAHVPGIVFVTSASYLAVIYALGDWPEFLGVSMLPLMIAAGLSILRADRQRWWPAIALAGSSIVFFGSHLLTVVWASTVLSLVGLAIVVCVPRARAAITWPRAIRVAGLVVPALLVSAWFLLPTAAFESHTVIAYAYPHWRKLLRETMYPVAARHLFTLSRATGLLTLSLPVLAIAWVLVSIAIFLWIGHRGTWMRILLIVSGATVLIGVVMTHAQLILALPRLYATLQFSFRLESYMLLGVSGAVLAALVLARGDARKLRLWTWMLAPIAIVSVVGAIQQIDSYSLGGSRGTALTSYLTPPGVPRELLAYVDAHLHYVERRLPEVRIAPTAVHDDRASAVVHLPPGRLVDTNIGGGPELVHVTGARIVGNDEAAGDVLEIGSGAGVAAARPAAGRTRSATTRTISVSPADSLPVVLGRLLTLLAILVLVVRLAAIAVRRHPRGERGARLM
jgi:hypothetical protein